MKCEQCGSEMNIVKGPPGFSGYYRCQNERCPSRRITQIGDDEWKAKFKEADPEAYADLYPDEVEE